MQVFSDSLHRSNGNIISKYVRALTKGMPAARGRSRLRNSEVGNQGPLRITLHRWLTLLVANNTVALINRCASLTRQTDCRMWLSEESSSGNPTPKAACLAERRLKFFGICIRGGPACSTSRISEIRDDWNAPRGAIISFAGTCRMMVFVYPFYVSRV